MAKDKNNQEEYYIDTAENLIKWDKFHFVNENWGKSLQRENIRGQSEDIILPASDLYLLAIGPDPSIEGMLKMLAVVDPLDNDIPHKLVTGMMNIHPKEPILIKHRSKYSDGPMEVIHLLSKKAQDCATEEQRLEMEDLKKKVEEYIAQEKSDGKDDSDRWR